ncbi:MAG TPA: ATP-binding protein, partial [Ktedonobacteraceae bacterium]|nr:ATP-binding protein [Ktedonobacteraceae bacterium]
MMDKPEKNPGFHFDIHASVVLQLGDTLISDVAQALVELVKNSYDADASYAKVIIDTEGKPGGQSFYSDAVGYISIEDDGIGMDEATIRRGWLTVSNSPKREMKRLGLTTEHGRTPLGDKGLGRLCAQRLAYNLEIFTRPQGSSTEYHLAFSWNSFLENNITLTEVPLFFEELPPQRSQGTKLLITGLKDIELWKDNVSETNPENLQVGLSRLISPYAEVQDFVVSVIFNGRRLDFAEYSSQYKRAAILNYKFNFDGKELQIRGKAKLDFFKPGRYTSNEEKQEYRSLVQNDTGKKFFDFLMNLKQAERYGLKKSNEDAWYIEYEYNRVFVTIDKIALLNAKPANPGPFHGELDSFYLDDRSDATIKAFVEAMDGLRVYRDGFGIRIDSDLFELKKQQTSGKSFYGLRPGNITGYIALSAKDNACLEETTNRESFQDTPYYKNFYLIMREFSKFTLDVQTFVRRGYNSFKEKEKTINMTKEDIQPEKISEEINVALLSATIHGESLKKTKETLEGVTRDAEQIRKITEGILPVNTEESQPIYAATYTIAQTIDQARKEVNRVEVYLQDIS